MTQTALQVGTDQSPQPGEHQRPGQALAAGVEDQSAAEQRARATQRLAALGEMTGGIAHDFRNLLAVIESSLRLAERSLDEPDKVRAFIAASREGIDRGVALTSQLLAFAKHGELDVHAGDVNLFLKEFEPFLRYGAGPEIRVVFDLAPEVPKCLIDPTLFDAAVLNLVVNARDAMTSGGEVRITTECVSLAASTPRSPPPGTYVRVRVKDGGQGMSPEVLRRVFEPFFTTKGEKGTGIGLPQVFSFMHLIGGYVDIASEQGIGTTFDLLFPSIAA